MTTKKVKNVAVLIRVPQPLLKKIDAAAKAQDRSRSYLVVEAVKDRMARKAGAT